MAVQVLDDMIARLAEMCAEATPESTTVLDYLLGDYPNYPHWRVGERDIEPTISESESLEMTFTVVARLYGGKVGKGYKGTTERDLRALAEKAVQYFADHLRFSSEAHPQGLPYMSARGVQFGRPRKVVDDHATDGPLLYYEFTWTVPYRVPRDVRA